MRHQSAHAGSSSSRSLLSLACLIPLAPVARPLSFHYYELLPSAVVRVPELLPPDATSSSSRAIRARARPRLLQVRQLRRRRGGRAAAGQQRTGGQGGGRALESDDERGGLTAGRGREGRAAPSTAGWPRARRQASVAASCDAAVATGRFGGWRREGLRSASGAGGGGGGGHTTAAFV
ncbi:LOW QUALITY PROTEIN: hypothetical protein BRADI_2g28191v3 [Brachypodium distachyon]|uniref:Uncharacterized protein n=1 Tax=Brachypodium distachyon TaxID=15368 RepID=A0A2K2DB40_BRADI|nr:LOW QUALITY PROTEIN: hypothetical protein BRADI_2g28191v3 [Brachypodium distachyon]